MIAAARSKKGGLNGTDQTGDRLSEVSYAQHRVKPDAVNRPRLTFSPRRKMLSGRMFCSAESFGQSGFCQVSGSNAHAGHRPPSD